MSSSIEVLIYEVENNLHIPIRFRAAPFTIELRDAYVAYLKRELARMKRSRLQ